MKYLFTVIISTMLIGTANAEVIGKVETSGVVFKDSISINAVDDPTITGVTCYVTTPSKSMSFEDQTDSALSCRRIGPVTGNVSAYVDQVFTADKNLFFKTMKVSRFYDAKRNVLIYISYTEKMGGDNASHSLSVVPLGD